MNPQTEPNGLQYMGARYYHSSFARFISADPVFLSVGEERATQQITGMTLDQLLQDPQLLNSYSYARGNPVKYRDGSGAFIDTVIDLGFIGYDLYQIGRNFSQGQSIQGDLQALGLDALGFVLPGVTGLGAVSRADDLARAAGKAGESASKVKQLSQNVAQGKAFENEVKKMFSKDFSISAEQVTIQAKDGTKTRVDFIGKDACGNCVILEAKSSQTAPLTKNQKTAFPQIGESGGVIVGSGKPGFSGGTRISPTKVKVIRR